MIDDQRQGDGVLLAAQKTLRAVHRIECPVRRARAVVIAVVDGVEHRVVVHVRLHALHRADDFAAHRGLVVGAQHVGAFLAHDTHIRIRLPQRMADDGLHREVGHRHGTPAKITATCHGFLTRSIGIGSYWSA
jgi:hypothetical protein